MKQFYILILLILISCTGKTKEKKETLEVKTQDTGQANEPPPIIEPEKHKEISVDFSGEDISGVYELIDGKTFTIDDESYEIYKSAIVIERLSENDFGFYAADKVKDLKPLGEYGVLRRMKNDFHQLRICSGEDVEGYTEGDFTTGLSLFNEVLVYKKGDILGMVHYGSNFRKYMRYKRKKKNADFYLSLVKTMNNTKAEYQEYLKEYEAAKNHDTSKLQVEHYLNGDMWLTKHRHKEVYASFEKTHFYQNPYQEGKFIDQDEIFKNEIANAAMENGAFEHLNFEDLIHAMDTKELPRIENTNFDDFIEAEDYKNIAIKALQLQKLYPDLEDKNSGYRAIKSYRVDISKAFYSVVVTILKGEHEMESLLINYGLNGEIIDSKVVSYDEIAEGQSRIESRISENSVTTNHIFWDVMMEIEQKIVTVDEDGTIEKMDSKNLNRSLANFPLILDVLKQLKLNPLNVKTDLIVSKALPQDPDDTIVVIPEIVSEGEQEFELNSHIAVVNTTSGKITHQYFESASTNQWVSDAIQLEEVKIDTAPYMIADNVRAFGVRVYYYGQSQANPYSNETISLFIKSDNTLKKVLNNYDVMQYGGEWDTNCEGEFIGSKATLAMSAEKTNDYFDIVVATTITETENHETENGDCESKDEVSTETKILKFEDKEYKTL